MIRYLHLLVAIIIIFPLTAFAAETYSNPVYEESFQVRFKGKAMGSGIGDKTITFPMMGIGDPAVIFHEGMYYMYTTGDNHSYHAYISPDLVKWTKGPQVFATSEYGVWAPDVFHDPKDNKFYLYYTVNRRIGVAVSDRPDSMFKDMGPLASGAIDAHMFLDDDGRYYLYYATYPRLKIHVQEMAGPLMKKDVPPIKLLAPSAPWEKKNLEITEAPWMLKHRGIYYLIYSGGGSNSADYAIGYATATSPTGPFTRYPGNPIIKKGNGVFGSGHGSVIKDRAGNLWLVYHQKYSEKRDWMRFIAIDPIRFDDQGVLGGKASRGHNQPAPVTAVTGKQ